MAMLPNRDIYHAPAKNSDDMKLQLVSKTAMSERIEII
jgi:hypothetical protein